MWLEIMWPSVNKIMVFILLHLVNSAPSNSYSGKHQVIQPYEIKTPKKVVPMVVGRQKETTEPNVQLIPQKLVKVNKTLPVDPSPPFEGFHNNEKDGKEQLASKSKKPPPVSQVSKVQDEIALQWPLGVVPYFIDRDTYDPPTIKRIVKMMGVVESSSCVVFNELNKQPEESPDFTWLHIHNPKKERECVHDVTQGDNDGEISLVLGFQCLYPNEILHSILHGIGLKDEVAHPHRDQYIRILWENIQPKYRALFRIQFEAAPYRLVEYDPMSIMHFHDRAFSANGAATIVPLIFGLQINPSNTLSPLDSMKLKLAFGHECNKRNVDDLLDTCKNALLAKEEHVGNDTEDHEVESSENLKPPNMPDNLNEGVQGDIGGEESTDRADGTDLQPQEIPPASPEIVPQDIQPQSLNNKMTPKQQRVPNMFKKPGLG